MPACPLRGAAGGNLAARPAAAMQPALHCAARKQDGRSPPSPHPSRLAVRDASQAAIDAFSRYLPT